MILNINDSYKKIYINESDVKLLTEKILDVKTIARDIAKVYNLPKPPPPVVIHRFAKAKGFGFKRVGGLMGYAENIKTEITQDPDTFKRCYLSNPDYNADKFIEPDRNPRFYVPESKFSKVMREAIDELELFHGSPHNFNEFDLAYLSTGFGQQSHGYGVYLTTSVETARAYCQGKNIYTVEVPDGKYLNYDKIRKSEAMTIAKKFFKYYMTENEYGREAYKGHENDFWEYECKYIGDCYDGGCVYGTLNSFLGNEKDTSEFLYRIGYTGLFLKCENTNTGEIFKNYVIFNAKDIKILKKENA